MLLLCTPLVVARNNERSASLFRRVRVISFVRICCVHYTSERTGEQRQQRQQQNRFNY